MSLLKRSKISRAIALFLVFLFFQSELGVMAESVKYQPELDLVKSLYTKGEFKKGITETEKFLEVIGDEHSVIRGKLFLLLGACYEKEGNKNGAVENYLLGDLLLDKPEVEGIDLNSLNIFMSTLYGKVIDGKRVFEKVSKRRKKRKFPYLAILGAAAIVVSVFLLMKKRTGDEVVIQSKLVANEIFNSIEWIEIPAGEFQMGDNQGLGSDDELPVHTVYLDSYKISKYEITYKQFNDYAATSGQSFLYHEGSGDDHPVVRVRWGNVNIFCEWITNHSGRNVKLPSEAQWEKAARGTGQVIYPWGNSAPNCSIVNYNNCIGGTKPVGSYPSDVSIYGVMDMGGNVSEIVYDAYDADYYSISPLNNPGGPGLYQNDTRILRGGNWSSNDLRTTNRTTQGVLRSNHETGFRIVWVD